MTPREFCYWLQGHFELSPYTKYGQLDKALWPPTRRVIAQHLLMVFECSEPSDTAEYTFCAELLTFMKQFKDAEPMTVTQTDVIKGRLNEVFEHTIDLSYGGADLQAKLQAIHSAMPPVPPRPVVQQKNQSPSSVVKGYPPQSNNPRWGIKARC